MKKHFILSLLVALILLASVFAAPKDPLNYATVYDLSQFKGNTYFSLMAKQIKPSLDAYATRGFLIKDSRAVDATLQNVDTKVAVHVIRRTAGGQAAIDKIADTLASRKTPVTFYQLPALVKATPGFKGDMYGLSTFLALASGGGVALRINERNFAYNVNYGTGKVLKDEMTGRSFGYAPGHKANDVSDKYYLMELERFVRSYDPAEFFRTLLQMLTACDPANYARVPDLGQTVLTDFMAVYTAEEDRHLMTNLRTHNWDSALLEVTLLAAFHSGQQQVAVINNDQLVDMVPDQVRADAAGKPIIRPASMIDWWQFSKNNQPGAPRRSGINITRRDFLKLGTLISAYERQNNPTLIAAVERHFGRMRRQANVFEALADFLINFRTPPTLGADAYQLSNDFTAFLSQVRADANQITAFIRAGGK